MHANGGQNISQADADRIEKLQQRKAEAITEIEELTQALKFTNKERQVFIKERLQEVFDEHGEIFTDAVRKDLLNKISLVMPGHNIQYNDPRLREGGVVNRSVQGNSSRDILNSVMAASTNEHSTVAAISAMVAADGPNNFNQKNTSFTGSVNASKDHEDNDDDDFSTEEEDQEKAAIANAESPQTPAPETPEQTTEERKKVIDDDQKKSPLSLSTSPDKAATPDPTPTPSPNSPTTGATVKANANTPNITSTKKSS